MNTSQPLGQGSDASSLPGTPSSQLQPRNVAAASLAARPTSPANSKRVTWWARGECVISPVSDKSMSRKSNGSGSGNETTASLESLIERVQEMTLNRTSTVMSDYFRHKNEGKGGGRGGHGNRRGVKKNIDKDRRPSSQSSSMKITDFFQRSKK